MANTAKSAALMRPRAATESVQDFVQAMGSAFDACVSDPGCREALRNAFIWDRLVLGLNAPEVQKELVSNLAWLPENVRELAGKIASKLANPTSPRETAVAADPTIAPAPALTARAPAPATVVPMQVNYHPQTALASTNSAGRKRSSLAPAITGPPKKAANLKKLPPKVDVNTIGLTQMPGIGASYASRLEAENIRQGKDLYTKFVDDFRRDQSRLETYLCNALRFRRNHARNLSDYLKNLDPLEESAREFLMSPPPQMIRMAAMTNNNMVASRRAPGDTFISRHGEVPGTSNHSRSLSRNSDRPPPPFRALRETPVILTNGHLFGGRSIVQTNDGSAVPRVLLSNTCPFDSLLQILSCSYLDSRAYRDWVDTREECALPAALRLARDMATDTVPQLELYRQRAALLVPHFPAEVVHEEPPDDVNAYRRFDCMSSMPRAVEVACSECPTARDTISCNSRTCPTATRRLPLHCLSADIMSSARERRQQPPLRHLLQELVRRGLENPEDSRCQEPLPGLGQASRCAGVRSTIRTVSGVHLFIEPLDLSSSGGGGKNDVNSCSQTSSSSSVTPENCPVVTLKELPSRLRLGAGRGDFILRGCVGFSGADDTDGLEAVGHFEAYCLRATTGRWQLFDDTSLEVYDEDDSAKVRCALLVYTV